MTKIVASFFLKYKQKHYFTLNFYSLPHRFVLRLFQYLRYYFLIYTRLNSDIYNFIRTLLKKNRHSPYKFIFNFKPNNRLFLIFKNNLQTKYTTYAFTSLGLFIKFFEKKKSLKKSKIIKFLMLKYFRKLFVFLKI